MDPKKLSRIDRFKAFSALMFLVEKHDSTIKSRKCALVESKQRAWEGHKKEDGASLTVATDSVIMTSVIVTNEERHTATLDLLSTYLHTENDEHIIMLLKWKLAELLVQIDPSLYMKYVITKSKGEPMLYVKLAKALYGLLKSTLFFYQKLQDELEDMRSEVNPYDPCAANKMVNGTQMTVCWHINDL